jgi:hypothetical protein
LPVYRLAQPGVQTNSSHREGANNANHDISLGGYPAMDAAQINAEVEKEDIIRLPLVIAVKIVS